MANGLVRVDGVSLVPQTSNLASGFQLGQNLAAQGQQRQLAREQAQLQQQQAQAQQQAQQGQLAQQQQAQQLSATALGVNQGGEQPTDTQSQQAIAKLFVLNPKLGTEIQGQMKFKSTEQKAESISFMSKLMNTPWEDRAELINRRIQVIENRRGDSSETRSLLEDDEEQQNKNANAVLISSLPLKEQMEIAKGQQFVKWEKTAGGGIVGITANGEAKEIDLGGVKLQPKTPLVQVGSGGDLKALLLQQKLDANKLKIEAAKDKAEQNKRSVVSEVETGLSSFDSTISAIDRLLVGGGLESAAGFQSEFPTIAGSPAADFEAGMETLQAKIFLSQVNKLKGLGALSEAEGKKLSAAMGALTTKVSDKKLRGELVRIKRELSKARKNFKLKFNAGKPKPVPSTAPANELSNEDLMKRIGL
jgi:hypothetical protein